MKDVISDLLDRNYSIEKLFSHIEDLSETKGKIDVIVVLKSSFFIALYNNIEATIYSVFEKIHTEISQFEFRNLDEPLQKIMLKYSFGKHAAIYIQDLAKLDAEKERIKNINFPQLHDYLRRQSLFSGNLDVRKIKEITKLYGMKDFPVRKDHADKMLWVKNKRNKISHGEQSMSDGGKGIKNSELRNAFESIDIILNQLVENARHFTENLAVHNKTDFD